MVIQPVSELKNYNVILDNVKDGSPVYLTKNGKGAYAIFTIEDAQKYDKYYMQDQFAKDINTNASDMNFFIKDIETLDKKLDKADEEAMKDTYRYTHDELFNKIKEDIYARKV